ncbi:mediator of RNA polymerase II transcription subunit 31 [Podarcis lilfordi]|uniref:Mediator of RNA polymerase II transcription subunit 31 n=2 Tax=Podarcis TaxID=42163 RepID=A0AA35LG22_9SAUR|nr:mediator of RNA polymerase II transcription subunit 31 [Podarcis lilfordi]
MAASAAPEFPKTHRGRATLRRRSRCCRRYRRHITVLVEEPWKLLSSLWRVMILAIAFASSWSWILAQRGFFKDKAFVNYLKYLLYWKEPEYAKYLKYPQCLHMLELLQYEHFRKELVNAQCAKFIDEQQILHWQHYSRKRMRLQQALAEQQQQQQQQNSTSVK